MSDSCLNGFFNDSELVEQTRLVNIGPVGYRGRQQILFPDIRFTCNGVDSGSSSEKRLGRT